MSGRAWIVSDLGWGDSGKGTSVDYLARARGARLVVRWNGGSQAGHRVVTDDGRAHVFAQIGAGSFVDGARTHLAETVLVDPVALQFEARALGDPSVLARMTIAESARVITPFHVAANRLREAARGDGRHGTTGCGVGEAVRDALDHPAGVVRARHLVGERHVFRRLLAEVQERLIASLADELRALRGHPQAEHPRALLTIVRGDYTESFLERLAHVAPARIVPDDAIDAALAAEDVVLEGAQGVLLDQDEGVSPPHVTWSRCTTHAAMEWLDAHGHRGARTRYGVMRTYATRHGAGPFPTEAPELAPLLPEPSAHPESLQGPFRVGWLDLERLRYAIAKSPIDALVATHLDRLGVLPAREGEPREPEPWIAYVEAALGHRIAITSHGPRASDKRER
ncbi:MAG: adenylosuccinate synthetase [Sandaracinus sp.]